MADHQSSVCQINPESLFLQRKITHTPGAAGPRMTAMLTFIVSFLQRKKGFTWSPAVDLSDPFVAAALAPMTHS